MEEKFSTFFSGVGKAVLDLSGVVTSYLEAEHEAKKSDVKILESFQKCIKAGKEYDLLEAELEEINFKCEALTKKAEKRAKKKAKEEEEKIKADEEAKKMAKKKK